MPFVILNLTTDKKIVLEYNILKIHLRYECANFLSIVVAKKIKVTETFCKLMDVLN